MAHSRDTACKYYICEGECEKGKEGTFNKACQKCKLYSPITHKKSFRPHNIRKAKREEYERQQEKEMMDEMWFDEENEEND